MNAHPKTNNPTLLWEELSKVTKVKRLKLKIPNKPVKQDKVRVVCMSDTHSLTSRLGFPIPDGDVFVHAGDFTSCGKLEEIIEFNNWLGNLPHRYKIIIAGNHELSFDPNFTQSKLGPRGAIEKISTFGIPREEIFKAVSCISAKSYLSNCIYLQDSQVVLYGIKFYGTPWQPEFNGWAFNLPRGEECLRKWNYIPDDTDILITHTPPLGYGDFCYSGVRAGCAELLTTVQKRVKPKYHVFGHIHEGYGVTTDDTTVFINSSTCDIFYQPINPPIVFDIYLPPGVQK